MSEASSYRLPRTVVPRRYELELAPDLASASFSGAERVDVEILEPTSEIVLNAIELVIDAARLVGADGTVLTGRISYDEPEERAIIALERSADPGPWRLELEFGGTLNDKLRGFYRSRYTDAAGQDHLIATTQFEATDARRAFPCWDEPDFKASFKVVLVIAPGLSAWSNAAVISEETLEDGRRRVEFAETIVMSTYLVAFVVAPFAETPAIEVEGVPLRVVCPPEKLALADFALEIGAASLRFFSSYFGIPYPADKLDLIAIPDFAFGAMENLGAVTFRETALLVDPASASRLELERVAEVVAHEIAHMWFGDLVTMRWWNGIWLNEAFATFMELLCVDEFRPQWESWVGFGVSRAAAMVVDGLATTRPVEFPVTRPAEAEAMFDVLTYQKGCAVLRMLDQYLGPEPFRRGIADYLEKHAYGNTETTDLWDAIEAASGEPARAVMDSWILQGGYPLVSVTPASEGRAVQLSQQRFRYLSDDDDAVRWKVPVALRASIAGELVEQRALLGDASMTVDLPGAADWVVANAGAAGFYRVRYEQELLDGLTAGLQSRLEPLERLGLVSDMWAAVLAERTPIGDVVSLLTRFGDEADADVWTAVLSPLRLFDKIVDGARPVFETFVRALAGPALGRIGWERAPGEPERMGQLRGELVAALGVLGADAEVRARCRQLYEAARAGGPAVAPDLADAVVTVVADQEGPEEFEQFRANVRNPATPQEEMRYLYGLARFRAVELNRRLLELCLTDEVRTQNAPYVIAQLLASRHAGTVAFDFVTARWDEICGRFPDNALSRMVEGLAAQVSAELAARARQFFTEHPIPQGELHVAQTLERLDVNARLATRHAPALADALAAADRVATRER